MRNSKLRFRGLVALSGDKCHRSLTIVATMLALAGCGRSVFVDHEGFTQVLVDLDAVAFDATPTGMIVATHTGLRLHDLNLVPGAAVELDRVIADVRRWDDERVVAQFEGGAWHFVDGGSLALGPELETLSTGQVLDVGRSSALLLAPSETEYIFVRGHDGDDVSRYPCDEACPRPSQARLNAPGTIAFIPNESSGIFLRTDTGEKLETELGARQKFGPVIFSPEGDKAFGWVEKTFQDRLSIVFRRNGSDWTRFGTVYLDTGRLWSDTERTDSWSAWYETGAWGSPGFKVFATNGVNGVIVMRDFETSSGVHRPLTPRGPLTDKVDRVRVVGDRFACAHTAKGLFCWEVPPFWRGIH